MGIERGEDLYRCQFLFSFFCQYVLSIIHFYFSGSLLFLRPKMIFIRRSSRVHSVALCPQSRVVSQIPNNVDGG